MRSDPPNLFLVGGMRCGTSTLHDALSRHPEVFMTRVKEPKRFALSGDVPRFAGPQDPENDRYWADPDRYGTLFRDREQARWAGESSTLYLHWPDAAAEIRRASPEARILVMLRDPVERAYSHYLYARTRGIEPEACFEAALSREGERLKNGWSPFWQYRARSRYAKAVKRFTRCFSRERVWFGLFDDLARRPTSLGGPLASFLGLAQPLDLLPGRSQNRSRQPRSLLAARLEMRLRRSLPPALRARFWRSRPWQRVVGLGRPIRNLYLGRPERIAPETEKSLRREFRPDVDRLEELLGVDLRHWRGEA